MTDAPRPLTAAERQARQRERRAAELDRLRLAMQLVLEAKTLRGAKQIAAVVLEIRTRDDA